MYMALVVISTNNCLYSSNKKGALAPFLVFDKSFLGITSLQIPHIYSIKSISGKKPACSK
ncbi:MAG: hypothetical protein ACI9BO_001453 [Zhongshania sp.]|jgi:hypothetical protein